jgi:serine/threonine-protein kinase
VKPSNVLFAGDGTVKLADLASVRAAEGAGTSVVTSVRERAQAYLYLSPEVILGAAEVGVAADVYSVGCVLYHLLAGRPPFAHADVNRQISAHFQDRPEVPSKLAAWIPPALDRAVMRCLEKDADKRYSDLEELGAVLEKI